MTSSSSGNAFLAHLEPSDKVLLAGRLRERPIEPRAELTTLQGDQPVVYFPCDHAILSLRTILKGGQPIECGLVGSEGMWPVGYHDRSKTIAMVYRGRRLLCMDADEFEKAKAHSPSLQLYVARYSAILLLNAMQLAACNAAHSVDQRLARWLLQMTSEAETNLIYLTHNDLEPVLGAGRSYVTRTLLKLLRRGIIRQQRGMIEVKDLTALKHAGCGCEDRILRQIVHEAPIREFQES